MRENSSLNLAIAIILLVTSIIAILGMILTYLAAILIPELSLLKAILNKGDYFFYLFAWTMLHSYMIVLSIEWLGEKSVKHDLMNTLYLMVAAGIWGIIRGSIIIGIISIIFYGLILCYIKKTSSEKLST